MTFVRPIFSAAIPSLIISQATEEPKTECLLKFKDGTVASIPLTVLQTLELFLSNPDIFEFEVKDCDLSTFQLVIALATEKKLLSDIATPEMLKNPLLFEELGRLLTAYCPKASQKILNDVREELSVISLKDALDVLGKHKSSTANITPYLVGIAEKTLMSSNFFADEKEAAKYFDTLVTAHLDYLRMSKKLVKAQSKYPLESPDVGFYTIQFKYLKIKLADLVSKINVDNAPPNNLDNIIRGSKNNPALAHMSSVAEKKLEEYGKRQLEALKKNGCAHRPDLYPYIIGTKETNYIRFFDYYGLILAENPTNPGYPYVHRLIKKEGAGFGYRLENPGPWELEEEIRTDLLTYLKEIELPPRLIHNSEITLVLSDEDVKFQQYILEQFKNWVHLPEEKTKEVIGKMLEHCGWTKFKITPEHITDFNPPQYGSKKATGNLRINGLQPLSFYFSIVNLKCIIDYQSPSADSHSTGEFLKLIEAYIPNA